MQYGKYEKLIVVEKGVELINWPNVLPFVDASDQILHTLCLLHTTLILMTSARLPRGTISRGMGKAKNTYHTQEAEAQL